MRAYPTFAGSVSIASYGVSRPAILVETFRPPAAKLDTAYLAIAAQVGKSPRGNVTVPLVSVSPGAAGGSMACGGQRGAAPISYCIWRGARTVGVMTLTGTPVTDNTQALTRELRAYAEH